MKRLVLYATLAAVFCVLLGGCKPRTREPVTVPQRLHDPKRLPPPPPLPGT